MDFKGNLFSTLIDEDYRIIINDHNVLYIELFNKSLVYFVELFIIIHSFRYINLK